MSSTYDYKATGHIAFDPNPIMPKHKNIRYQFISLLKIINITIVIKDNHANPFRKLS